MGLTSSDFDRLNQIQAEDRVTAKDFDSAEFELLPEGNYLTVVDDLSVDQYNGTTKEGAPYSCDRIIITLKVLEPAKYAGKLIKWNRVNLYAKGEPEWARTKRIAFLTATGMVRKGDSAAVAAFQWAGLQRPTPMKFVFEVEHKMGEDKDGNKRLRAEGKGWSGGFKPATSWGTAGVEPAGTAGQYASTATSKANARPQQGQAQGQGQPKPNPAGQTQPAAAGKYDDM